MLFEVESTKPLDQIDTDLRDAAARHKFGILGVIDLKEKMNEKGVDYTHNCRVYEVCNPHQAKRVLDANAAVSTALPCRISVYGDAGAYKIATIRPTALIGGFDIPAMKQVAEEVERDLVAMMKESA